MYYSTYVITSYGSLNFVIIYLISILITQMAFRALVYMQLSKVMYSMNEHIYQALRKSHCSQPLYRNAPEREEGFFMYIILYRTQLSLEKASRGRILGRNPEKSLKSFSPCYSQSYRFALRFLFLQTHATSFVFSSNSPNLLLFLQ
jgi:hypothetical protein